MKKYIILILLALTCYGIKTSHAAPAYGTTMPQKNHFSVGGQTYSVVKRDLDQDRGEMRSLQHFMLISYGLTDWLSVDLKGGAGDIEQAGNNANTIQYPGFVGGGYGFRVKLYEQDKAKAVFGFQHISIHPYSIFIDTVKHKAVLDDWQLSLLYSYRLNKFIPYAGAKWSRMDYIHWENDERERVKSDVDKSYGIVLGTDFFVTDRIRLNIEGQFVDVQAASASIIFNF